MELPHYDIPQLFFTIMSFSLITDVLISEWFNSKGKLHIVYPLNVIKFSGFLILETCLALNNHAQIAMLLFNISNLFGLLMNIQGIRRLKQENKWPY